MLVKEATEICKIWVLKWVKPNSTIVKMFPMNLRSSLKLRAHLRYTWEYLTSGICSLIKPAAVENIIPFRANIQTIMWWYVYHNVCVMRFFLYLLGLNRLWASGIRCDEDSRWYWLTGPELRSDMWEPGQPDGLPSKRVVIWDYTIGDQRAWNKYKCLCEHGRVCSRIQSHTIALPPWFIMSN